MSLLDTAMQLAKQDGSGNGQADVADTSGGDGVAASSGFGIAAPASTMVNSIKPDATGTDLPAPTPAPAPDPTAAPTPAPASGPLATTNSVATPSLMDTVAASAPPAASASFTAQPLARTNTLAAAAPAAYTGGTSYNDAIKFYNDNAAIANAPTYNGETTAGASWAPPQYSPNLQQAQSDFVSAITAGQDTGVSLNDLAGLGVGGGNEVYPQNDLMGSGAFKPNLMYGDDGYQNYAQTLGAQLGLSSDQVAKAVGSVTGPAYQNSMNTGQAPFQIGNTPLAQQFTNAIYAAAGKTPDPDQQAKAQQLDGYYSQLRQVQGHDHGIFGGGFGAFLALAATAGIGSAFLAPAVAAEGAAAGGAAAGAAGGEAAGGLGTLSTADALGEFGGIEALGGTQAGSAAAAAGTAGSAAGAATVLPGVTVTGAAAGGATAGQVAAGGAAVGAGAGFTEYTDPSTGQTIQRGDPVSVTSSTPPATTPAFNPLPAITATTPFVAQLLQNIPNPDIQQQTLNEMQKANLDPDQSKWNLSDWQTYLKIASSIAGLLGSGGSTSASSPAAASTTTGSIQVPTTTPFGTPAPDANSTAGSGQSLMDAAAKLNINSAPTATLGTGTNTAAANTGTSAPLASSANTPAGFTAATAPTANTVTVTPDQTVADQLTKLLSSTSPYIDQARQRAIQQANARGLQNGTLAGQSGEEAAISQALPIAQQDAATYSSTAKQNAQEQDTAAALAENQRESSNATGVQQASLMENQRQFNASQSAAAAALAESTREFNASSDQKIQLANLSTDTQISLANIEAQYKTQIQSSSDAQNLYKDFQDQVALISTNANMDAPNKQAAINLAASNLKNGFAVLSKINGLNISSILQFQ